MVTLTGTSYYVGIVKKNVLPEKSLHSSFSEKTGYMEWHSKGTTQNDMHPNFNRRNGFFLSGQWMPLIPTLKATRQQAFSNSVIDPTS